MHNVQLWGDSLLKTIALTFLIISSAIAAEEPVNLSSKAITGNVNKVINAEGDVVITFKSVKITGDKATYNKVENVIKVIGNVTVEEGETSLKCSRIIYDLSKKRAVIENVSGKLTKSDYIKAKRIDRLSEKEWIAYDGIYTPCKQKCPDWSLGAKRFKILLGESFEGRWVTFRVKEIPIMASPYISGSLVKKRRTGFLIPRIGYRSDDGFIYKQPFYLVLGRSADATFTYEKRFKDGEGKEIEVRYLTAPYSKGNLKFRHFKKEGESNKWKLTYEHNYWPSDFSYGNVDIEAVSNRSYYKDVDVFDIESKTSKYTKSDASYSKLWKHAIFNVNTVYLDRLDGSTDYVFQKVPNINFYIMDTALFKTPFTFNFDSDFTYFYRKKGYKGTRLNVKPGIRYSTFLGKIKNTTTVSYLTSYYDRSLNSTSPSTRGIFKFENRSFSNFYYYVNNNFSFSINPEIAFLFTENEDQEDLPDYDVTDRIKKQKSLLPMITSYIYFKSKQIARVSLEGNYNFYNQEDPWEIWKLDLDTNPLENLWLKETVYYSPHEKEVKNLNSFISTNFKGINFWLNHYYDFTDILNSNYLRWGIGIPINRFLSFSYEQRYDIKLSHDRERIYKLNLNRGCWNGDITYRWLKNFDDTVDYQIMVNVNLVKLGSYGYKVQGKLGKK